MSNHLEKTFDALATALQWLLHAVLSASALGAIVGVLPFVFGIPAFIFYLIQIYESRFVKDWVRNRRRRQAERLRAKLEQLQRLDNV